MKISREVAIAILKYCHEHPSFYFPFLVMCQEYTPEDDDFVEIEPEEWEMIQSDDIYQTFELWENLQNLDTDTVSLMAKGFLGYMTQSSLEEKIEECARGYRKEWKEELSESANIEEFGLNEFLGGKAEGFEEALCWIRKYRGVPDDQNSVFLK